MTAVRAPDRPRAVPPGPRARWFGEHVLALKRNRLEFLQRMARHGDVAHVRIGPQPVYLFRHPDAIKEILVTQHRNFIKGRGLQRAKRLLGEGLLTSEGAFHLRQRRLAQPAFHRQRIAGYAATMAAYAERAAARWRDGQETDIAEEMMRLTLAIAGKTLFDADVEDEAEEIGEALTAALEMFSLALLPGAELMDRLPLPHTRRFNRARARLDAVVYRMIDERRASGEDRGDLLSMLMLARDTDGDGGAMTDEQVRDEAMTILLAGHETTANALAWTWDLLGRHEAVEHRLHAEADALGSRPLGMDDVAHLPYTRMVLAESMRLYPPAWVVGYRAVNACTVADWDIPPRALCVMSQFIVHRDERWFPDPERFDPERWTPERQAERPRFAYFPFGGGPRQCIGEQFAWTEGVLLLATIARRWRIRPLRHAMAEPYPVFTLRPGGGVPVRFEPRSA
jgi:cytochrome P450